MIITIGFISFGIFGVFSNVGFIVDGYEKPEEIIGIGWDYLYGIFLSGVLIVAGSVAIFYQIRMWKANKYLK
ncbi:hypothetical protein BD31_I0005 [Candidatus Nitrosopumilus salaria BD31]|uniref:Uncharacterized protein n=1 Tax=Candidatus Nitrosopumilus salarius BD31 TaxID=859350 RepID=I3D2M8_9ARCH|nr:hypothetical protein BD31_I0005 [Candidatus Nitrosopumilus salaria BD31]